MTSLLTIPNDKFELTEHTIATTDELLVNEAVLKLLIEQPVYLSLADENTTVNLWWYASQDCWAAEIWEQDEYRTSITNTDLHEFIDEVEHIRSRYAYL